MLGPLVQGAMLISVVFWYSKGMLTLINDYYREEFKTELEKDPKHVKFLQSKELKDDKSKTILSEEPAVQNVDDVSKIQGLPDILNNRIDLLSKEGTFCRSDYEPKTPATPVDIISIPLSRSAPSTIPGTEKTIKLCASEPISDKILMDKENLNDQLLSFTIPSSKSHKMDEEEEQILDGTNHEKIKLLLDLRKSDYGSSDDSQPSTRRNSERRSDNVKPNKSILNPSVANKLSYEQITNQQVSDVNEDDDVDDDGKLLTTTMVARTQQKRCGSVIGNYPRIMGNVYNDDEVDGSKKFTEKPRSVSATRVNQYLELKNDATNLNRSQGSCRRKSVNELVAFWTKHETEAEIVESNLAKQKICRKW